MKLWIARIALGLTAAVFTLGLVAAAAGPLGARRALEQRLGELTGRNVTIGDLRIAPWSGAVTILDLRVHAGRGREPALRWDRVRVRPSIPGLLRGEIALASVDIDGLHLRARRNEKGWEFQDIVDRIAAGRHDTVDTHEPRRDVRIDALRIRGLRTDLVDTTGGGEVPHTYGPLDADVRDISTDAESDGGFSLAGQVGDGATVALEATFRVDLRTATVDVRVDGLPVAPYAAYIPYSIDAAPVRGRLNIAGTVRVTSTEGRLGATFDGGTVALEDLDVRTRAGEPLAAWAALHVSGLAADPVARRFASDSIRIRGLALHAHRRADGTFAGLGTTDAADAPHADDPSVEVAATLEPGEVTLEDARIAWRDDVAGATLDVRIDRAVGAFAQSTRDEATLEASLRFGEAGTVLVRGVARPDGTASATVEVDDVPLEPFGPYGEALGGPRVARGQLGGKVAVDLDAQGPVSALGAARLESVAFEQPGSLSAAWDRLILDGIAWRREPAAFSVDAVRLEEPEATWTHASAAEEPGEPRTEETRRTAGRGIALAFPRIDVADATLRVVDTTQAPAVEYRIDEGAFLVEGLSSAADSLATVSGRARIGASGTLEIQGRTNPLAPALTTDLVATARGIDLRPASPYFQRFVGYALQAGDLRFDLRYTIDQRRLRAANLVYLDRFELGRATPGPEATSYPVGLAVAVLRDRSGTIKLDLPVEGSLDDPEFRIGRIVLRALGNILQSAATAPFRLLGVLLPGGGADDAVREDFAPGTSELAPPQTEALRAVARALVERPGLRVAIVAGVDPVADGEALLRAARAEALRRLAWSRLGRDGDPADDFVPTPRQRDDAVRAWFAARSAVLPETVDLRVAGERFAATVEADPGALERLAQERTRAVASVLEAAGVEAARIRAAATTTGSPGPRAEVRLE